MASLRDLKIGQKLALIVLMMSVPIAVLVWLFIDARNVQIEAAQREMQGVEYLRPLRGMLEMLPEHRAESHMLLLGDAKVSSDLRDLQPRIDALLPQVDNIDRVYGGEFGTSQLWDHVKQQWRDIEANVDSLSPEESFQRHSDLINDVTSLMRMVGDQAGLVLDPELDTHFLVEASVSRLPRLIETVGVVQAIGGDMFERRTSVADAVQSGIDGENGVNLDSRQTLNRLIGQIETETAELQRGVKAAYAANSELEGQLRGAFSGAFERSSKFVDAASQLIIDPTRRTTGKDTERLDAAAAGATEGLLAAYDSALSELNRLLDERVTRLTAEKYLQLSAATFILAFAVVLILFLNRTVTIQIGEINGLLSRIGVGDLTARARVRSGDELGQMTQALNRMLDNTLTLVQSSEERDRIQQSIHKLLDEIAGVAEGDLTQEAEVTAEITGAIADSFNYMIGELRTVIAQVQQTTLQVSAAANQIQGTAEKLAEGSEEQSSDVIAASMAVDQMASAIQQVSDSASKAAGVAALALANAQSGAETVTKTMQGMESIRKQVQETSKRIKRLGESSQEIGEISELIGELADRTSMLAMNASIQASMAGESGRGFAVVAQEVEGLAEQATEATKRIGSLIAAIQEDMTEAVAAMEDTTKEVVDGSGMANEAGQSLEKIETVSQKLAELIQQISQASEQQARGSEGVARAMSGISSVQRDTASGARDAATSIRNMAALADELRHSVSRFKIPVRAMHHR